MSLGLKLLPMNWKGLCTDVIDLGEDRILFSYIERLEFKKGVDVPREGISCLVSRLENGETGFGTLRETPYGNKLKSLLAGELSNLFATYDTQNNYIQKAVFAYVACLPKDYVVYLYWN